MKKPMRGMLEVRLEDGGTAFYDVERILLSLDLQRRCMEKRVLRNIINRLREEGRLVEVPYIGPR